jgi:lactate dehydrogenase-like 2-hydroxyacid dehydrogenase
MTAPLIFLDPFPRNEMMVYDAPTEAALSAMGRVVAHFGSRAPDDLVDEVLPEVAVIVGQTAMPKDRLDRAPNLRAILNVKANWEPNIDYAEAHARGIQVLSAAPCMAPAVAEFCIGQAVMLARGLHRADALFRAGQEGYGIGGNGRPIRSTGPRSRFWAMATWAGRWRRCCAPSAVASSCMTRGSRMGTCATRGSSPSASTRRSRARNSCSCWPV